jgi:hypothetical protein
MDKKRANTVAMTQEILGGKWAMSGNRLQVYYAFGYVEARDMRCAVGALTVVKGVFLMVLVPWY